MVMEYCDRGSLHQAIAKGLFKTSSKWNNKVGRGGQEAMVWSFPGIHHPDATPGDAQGIGLSCQLAVTSRAIA